MKSLSTHRIIVAVILLSPLLLQAPIFSQSRGAKPPQRGQRGTAATQPSPLTLRQVIEALSSSRNSTRVEGLISKQGVQFEGTPAVLDILRQFGASPKLLSMIPLPPPPPLPPVAPPPILAGPLVIVCEPKDCAVVVDGKYEGTSTQNRKTITGLRPGQRTVQIFAEGYEHAMRAVQLEEQKSHELTFSLKRPVLARHERAQATLLTTLTRLGGVDGLAELGNIEGAATMNWTNSTGQIEQWSMTFNKRAGRDLTVTFKSPQGQCNATILLQVTKHECRGGLKNRAETIAEQGTVLFLSYQLQDVIHALLQRPLITAEASDNRLESIDTKDSYVLTLGDDGLPTDLVYEIANGESPIHVRYSDYVKLNKGRYPGRIAIGRLTSAPTWVFSVNTIRSRVVQVK